MKRVIHLPLGRADYARTYALQQQLQRMRQDGEIGDVVITVEHNPVFTIGRSGSRTNIRVSEQERERSGIPVYEIDRGGDITYHGPGQLVCYPIIDLRGYRRDIKWYIASLEQGMIDLCADLGVAAKRRAGYPGVWVGERKIASIGVSVRHWVTMHGLAFNVDVNREHFAMIDPCGLPIEMASLVDLVSDDLSMGRVTEGLLKHMKSIFGWDIVDQEAGKYWRSLDV
ncbi:lipoyl(octanoyl) transferase LipB [Candidatus Bipolaricaulota bacterium]|nr:lipoyl(octanoyl) transferase LipB [Candidatus Bipolaricaulota bacterium]